MPPTVRLGFLGLGVLLLAWVAFCVTLGLPQARVQVALLGVLGAVLIAAGLAGGDPRILVGLASTLAAGAFAVASALALREWLNPRLESDPLRILELGGRTVTVLALPVVWGCSLTLLDNPEKVIARRVRRSATGLFLAALLVEGFSRGIDTFGSPSGWPSWYDLAAQAGTVTFLLSGLLEAVGWAIRVVIGILALRRSGNEPARSRWIHGLCVAWILWVCASSFAGVVLQLRALQTPLDPSEARQLFVDAGGRLIGYFGPVAAFALGLAEILRLRQDPRPLKAAKSPDMIVPR